MESRPIIPQDNVDSLASNVGVGQAVDSLASPHLPHIARHGEFLNRLALCRRDCAEKGSSLTVLVADIDGFHRFNEVHSPELGNLVLTWFSSRLVETLGNDEMCSHFQGDQFVVVLPHGGAARAREVIERCRMGARCRPFTTRGGPHDVTFTVGVVESSPGCAESCHQLLRRAQIALSQGKHRGPGSVVPWASLATASSTRERRPPPAAGEVACWLEHACSPVRQARFSATRALVEAVDARDPHTRIHSLTVSDYAEAIGRRMGLPERELATLKGAALLHDVGKIGVPDAILAKPGALTSDEYEVVKRHPQTALDILRPMSFLAEEAPMILHHHERFDGAGYPRGLKGEDIPLGARIVAVADALDTMLSPRSYKDAFPVNHALEELRSGAGTQFDPAIAEIAARWFSDHCPLPSTVDATEDSAERAWQAFFASTTRRSETMVRLGVLGNDDHKSIRE